jgi:hypothetical protein
MSIVTVTEARFLSNSVNNKQFLLFAFMGCVCFSL